jgi:hypothetical protein
VYGISRSTAHRIVAAMTRRLAALAAAKHDRRWSWVLDGTLVPTRDHARAARSKNYRWSCNAQVLIRRRDLRIIASSRRAAAGPAIATIRCTTAGRRSRPCARSMAECWRTVDTRGVPELVTPVFRANRIVRDRAWRWHRRRRARVEHAIARLKDWRVLRDHRRRGRHLAATLQAVAALHNLRAREWASRSNRDRNGSRGIDIARVGMIYVRSANDAQGREVGPRQMAPAEGDHG